MKTDHRINWKQTKYSKSLIALICLLLALTFFSGCITTHFVREGIGKRAKIKFEVLHPEMPSPMIHWIEYPNPNETALTLNPQLPNCGKLRFFVNPTKSDPHELSDKLEEVELINLRTEKDKQKLWDFVPPDQCAVLLTVGYSDFVGLSASTRSGVFEKHEISFQKDIEGNPGDLIIAAVAGPFHDAFFSPLYLMMGLADAGSDSPDDVTVVLDFPDGRRMETNLTYDEASRILKDHYFDRNFFEFDISPSRFANFWLHAALIELRLDFRIQGYLKNQDSSFFQAYIKSIDKFEGNWLYQIDNSAVESDLTKGLGLKSVSLIRFYISSN